MQSLKKKKKSILRTRAVVSQMLWRANVGPNPTRSRISDESGKKDRGMVERGRYLHDDGRAGGFVLLDLSSPSASSYSFPSVSGFCPSGPVRGETRRKEEWLVGVNASRQEEGVLRAREWEKGGCSGAEDRDRAGCGGESSRRGRQAAAGGRGRRVLEEKGRGEDPGRRAMGEAGRGGAASWSGCGSAGIGRVVRERGRRVLSHFANFQGLV